MIDKSYFFKVSFFILTLGIVFNLGIVMNPGYFSHDEISWGLKSIHANHIPYTNIFSYNDFHYRPLNFNLWLFLSSYLYEHPQLFHLAILFLGLLNSITLHFILIRLNIEKNSALLASIISTFMPSIVFVNGWIGTIGDIAWLFFCLLSFYTYITLNKYSLGILTSCALFIIALMFKETAVIYPGLIFIYLVYSKAKCNRSIVYFLLVTAIFSIYLYLRFDYLFAKNVSGYSTSIYNIPERMAEYFIYPFLWKDIEIHGMLSMYSKGELIISILLHLAFIICVCKKKIVNYFYYFSLYYVASVPMLILSSSLPHYMYGAGYVMAVSSALLISRGGFHKYLSFCLLSVMFIHSLFIQNNFIATGSFQKNMYTSIYSIMMGDSGNKVDNKKCYAIISEEGTPVWIAIRALFNVDAIYGIDINKEKIYLLVDSVDDEQLYDNNGCRIINMNKEGYVYEKNN